MKFAGRKSKQRLGHMGVVVGKEDQFKPGDRCMVKNAMSGGDKWIDATIVSTNKSGAHVKLDGGPTCYKYWDHINPPRRERSAAAWKNPEPVASATPSSCPPPPSPAPQPTPPPALELVPQPKPEPEREPESQAVSAQILTLTPSLAAQLLGMNEKNRSMSAKHLAKLRRAAEAGDWKMNGDTISIAKSGRLLNGQHRCQMVIETGKPIEVILVEGLDDDVFATIDRGRARNHGDVLHVLGHRNCVLLAAALSWVVRYTTGRMEQKVTIEHARIQELIAEHEDLPESVTFAGTKRTAMTPSLLAALHYLFSKVDRAEADRFVLDVMQGTGLSETDAVYVLRERLIKNQLAKAKLPHFEVAALAIKAFNARCAGQEVRQLRWRGGGELGPEPFPMIRRAKSLKDERDEP